MELGFNQEGSSSSVAVFCLREDDALPSSGPTSAHRRCGPDEKHLKWSMSRGHRTFARATSRERYLRIRSQNEWAHAPSAPFGTRTCTVVSWYPSCWSRGPCLRKSRPVNSHRGRRPHSDPESSATLAMCAPMRRRPTSPRSVAERQHRLAIWPVLSARVLTGSFNCHPMEGGRKTVCSECTRAMLPGGGS